jgi:hypothetical protein
MRRSPYTDVHETRKAQLKARLLDVEINRAVRYLPERDYQQFVAVPLASRSLVCVNDNVPQALSCEA